MNNLKLVTVLAVLLLAFTLASAVSAALGLAVPAQPDLAIVGLSAEPVAQNSPSILFKATVKNLGNKIAKCYQVNMGFGDGKGIAFTYFLPDMEPGASVTKEWVHIYEPGNYTAKFVVGGRTSRDPADTVNCATFFPRDNNGNIVLDDADLSNNEASKTVAMVQTGVPDLAIVGVSTSSVPTPAGEEVSFKITVKNVGTFGTYDYRFGCDFGDGTACFAFTLGDVSIAPGGVRVEEYKHVYTKPGAYKAVFEVGTKVDADLSNNKLSKTVVTKAAKPVRDAAITYVRVVSRAKVNDWVKVIFAVNVKNAGETVIENFVLRSDFGDGAKDSLVDSQDLLPGKSRVVNINHVYTKSGTYTAAFTVNQFNDNEENMTIGDDDNPSNDKVLKQVTITFSQLHPPCGYYGDVNYDGLVTQEDVKLVFNYLAGKASLTPQQLKNADVTGNGLVTVADAVAIKQYVDWLLTTFPVCEK